MNLLENKLDYATKRHKILSTNIANVDTADYKASDISFQVHLSKNGRLPLVRTDPAHLPKKQKAGQLLDYEVTQSDEKVVIDKEMANIAENHLTYNATVEMLARKFRGLETVLKETK